MNKILNLENAEKIAKQERAKDAIIVLVGGCFDILHKGHLTYLEEAKKQGDVLLVALESDENVRRLKGTHRPINNQQQRAKKLATLEAVDFVFLLPTLNAYDDYLHITRLLLPDVIAITEGDPKTIEKKKQIKAVGGKVVVVTNYIKDHSTTNLIQKV